MDTSITALRRFSKLARDMGSRRIETIATCAVREAENGTEFVKRIQAEAGLDVEVISAEEEALYAYRSVRSAFDISDQNIAVVDIGGGSTEIVFVSAGHVEKIIATPLGAVRVTEKYRITRGLFGEEYDRLIDNVGRDLKKKLKTSPLHSTGHLWNWRNVHGAGIDDHCIQESRCPDGVGLSRYTSGCASRTESSGCHV